MNSSELLAVARDELGDAEAPFNWSDATLFRYIDDAQKMFCRLTEGIEDSRTPEITRFTVTPGNEWYPLSPLVLKVRTITGARGRAIALMNHEVAEQHGVRFTGRQGPVTIFVSGEERGSLRAWPLPSMVEPIQLSVFRLPLEPITARGQELEVAEQHHEHLLLWVKHRVLARPDAAVTSNTQSAEFADLFKAYCFSALKEQERARRSTGVVTYGGL